MGNLKPTGLKNKRLNIRKYLKSVKNIFLSLMEFTKIVGIFNKVICKKSNATGTVFRQILYTPENYVTFLYYCITGT